MNMNDMVVVTSMVNATVNLTVPQHNFSRTWPRKGAKFPIPKDILREAIFDLGVETLFKQGTLYIDDMAFKVELGLEEADATVETAKIMALDDKLAMRIVKAMPLPEAKSAMNKLTKEQLTELADFAVAHYQEIDMARVTELTKKTGVDILKAIQVKKQMEE